ncbi:hypothetical protein [Streptomyces solicathayae]|uniref:DUF3592 domain-containing protein n=2 Tax=Streptomyces TaxID=1883 RepID=A0ABZ0LYE8_9ACTN|nr:hypothetical protein [Streptomyces sp. HUAS YS2]WOX24469.1 hypothetical protein R2D22_25040 [Streptomyces sp. HUAS YS2]
MTSPIPVLQGDQSTELRSMGEELLLRRPHDELRIPLAAIARIRVERRVVTVELTAPAGIEPTVYRIEDVSRAAADAFADAVNAALPARTAGEDAADGSALVTTRTLGSPDEDDEDGPEPVPLFVKGAAVVVGVGLAALSAFVGVATEHVGRGVAVLLVGGVGALFAFGVVSALWTLWENWYLSRHGITVDATQAWLDGQVSYVYTDTTGKTHTHPESVEDETIRVAYSPRKPRKAILCQGWGHQVKGLFVVLFLLALASPAVYGAYALASPAFGG